jgi:hypothetical protein
MLSLIFFLEVSTFKIVESIKANPVKIGDAKPMGLPPCDVWLRQPGCQEQVIPVAGSWQSSNRAALTRANDRMPLSKIYEMAPESH